jgi:hypothetical protein
MSNISLEGNASGTGTFTIAAPNTNSNYTITLPQASGTILTSGGSIEFAAGSASSPSITFTGDTNTGIFSPAADTIAFAEGGTEAMRINSSGNVGIGTTSPAYQLDINNASSYSTIGLRQGGTLYGYVEGGSSAVKVGTNGAIPMLFEVNGTERARLNTTGAFVLSGGTTTANGVGITFPATQSASTNANTLDDYEEGTYTPGYANFSTTGTVTITGRYIKIGRLVFISVVFSSTGTIGYSASALIDVPFSGEKDSSNISMRLNSNSSAQNSNQAGTQLNTGEVSFTRFFVGSFTTTSSGQGLVFAGTYEAQS